jgi:hypothetical protein
MHRRKRKISEGIFDEQDSRQQASGILGHGSVTTGVPEQVAKVIVGVKESFAGDLEIFVESPDDQGNDSQDDHRQRPAHPQDDVADNIQAAGQEEAHAHVSAEMDQLRMVRQGVGKDKSKVDNGRQEYGPCEFMHGILLHHYTPFTNPVPEFPYL